MYLFLYFCCSSLFFLLFSFTLIYAYPTGTWCFTLHRSFFSFSSYLARFLSQQSSSSKYPSDEIALRSFFVRHATPFRSLQFIVLPFLFFFLNDNVVFHFFLYDNVALSVFPFSQQHHSPSFLIPCLLQRLLSLSLSTLDSFLCMCVSFCSTFLCGKGAITRPYRDIALSSTHSYPQYALYLCLLYPNQYRVTLCSCV